MLYMAEHKEEIQADPRIFSPDNPHQGIAGALSLIPAKTPLTSPFSPVQLLAQIPPTDLPVQPLLISVR